MKQRWKLMKQSLKQYRLLLFIYLLLNVFKELHQELYPPVPTRRFPTRNGLRLSAENSTDFCGHSDERPFFHICHLSILQLNFWILNFDFQYYMITVNYGVRVDLLYKSTSIFLAQNSGLDMYLLYKSTPNSKLVVGENLPSWFKWR